MDDSFQIPVTYKGEDLLFNASLKVYGYVHKIEVDVAGQYPSGEVHLGGDNRLINFTGCQV
jgi:hypothetical protein